MSASTHSQCRNHDELVKSLFSPQSTQRSQRKYFYFQQVISLAFVLSVVNFQFLPVPQPWIHSVGWTDVEIKDGYPAGLDQLC
jgi:hypothetical protein